MPILPLLPGHKLQIVADETRDEERRGFMYVRRLKLRARFSDGVTSDPFSYDCAHRSRMDAVVVLPHYQDPARGRMVVLRSALRPPLFARPEDVRPVPELDSLGELWELPAGLVEEDERTPEGLAGCAVRELFEETGFQVAASDLAPLGPSTFPSPGMIGERHFFFHATIDPSSGVEPPEDGSALERLAKLAHVPLRVALDACRAGEIEDAKTELALRRLAEIL